MEKCLHCATIDTELRLKYYIKHFAANANNVMNTLRIKHQQHTLTECTLVRHVFARVQARTKKRIKKKKRPKRVCTVHSVYTLLMIVLILIVLLAFDTRNVGSMVKA